MAGLSTFLYGALEPHQNPRGPVLCPGPAADWLLAIFSRRFARVCRRQETRLFFFAAAPSDARVAGRLDRPGLRSGWRFPTLHTTTHPCLLGLSRPSHQASLAGLISIPTAGTTTASCRRVGHHDGLGSVRNGHGQTLHGRSLFKLHVAGPKATKEFCSPLQEPPFVGRHIYLSSKPVSLSLCISLALFNPQYSCPFFLSFFFFLFCCHSKDTTCEDRWAPQGPTNKDCTLSSFFAFPHRSHIKSTKCKSPVSSSTFSFCPPSRLVLSREVWRRIPKAHDQDKVRPRPPYIPFATPKSRC